MRRNSDGRAPRNPDRIHWNSEQTLSASSIWWRVGEVTEEPVKKSSGRQFTAFVHQSGLQATQADELPIEFFNNQLLEVDTSDPASVRAFLKWGFPYSPFRDIPEELRDYMLEGMCSDKQLAEEIKCGIGDTDTVFNQCPPSVMLIETISEAEATTTIHLLQNAVYALHDAIRNNTSLPDEFVSTINLGASNSKILRNGTQLKSWDFNNLTNAICNQILETVFDAQADWYECEWCGKVFKRQQGASKKHRPDADSRFCSRQPCKNRFYNANR